MKLESAITGLRDAVRIRHLAYRTEQAYVGWLTRFSRFVRERGAGLSHEQKVEAFLTQLAHQSVAASTQNQAFNAIVFFYEHVAKVHLDGINALRAKRPERIRTAPSEDEVWQLLDAVQDVAGYPTRLIVQLLYGCGLRVTEPLNLRIQDLKLSESRMIIRAAKGDKDRVVSIPCLVMPALLAQVEFAKGVAARDKAAGIPVALPGLLARKYPHWQWTPRWAWLFPAHTTCAHPRTGQTVRWRCHEKNVQRCVAAAARQLGLCITPHQLRHAYATHNLNHGINIKALQAAMGHVNVQTTIGYCHADACSVPSPLDTKGVDNLTTLTS